ncbi:MULTISPECIES: PD-(D/E)XK nuclease family protein [unclassified Acinetobacter]|uniref:PD-(D/E)XK nuclease family protein n=1 Tax=unclassified Acinetobacter TaxID=196816 RepID=UPI0025BB9C7A|nr:MULTISPECIES: PD-(D/E)XK nuclease family protein [unclassified Acinetobacter]
MNKPNIFQYATKELSQDAFIFWLLDHANPAYAEVNPKLKECALKLINEFFILENKIMPDKIDEFILAKQYKNIDILLKINNFSIIIEDKTGTNAHGGQLTRYKNIIISEVGEENVLAIFFKTHDQSNYKKELADGFKIFSRDKLINLLNSVNDETSDIFNDFKDYIESIENEVNAFTNKDQWNHKNWIGFFKYLQKELNRGDWGYVANPNGGFMGYWWAFQKNENCWQYLQIQQDDLVLKINSNKPENDKKFRNICYQHFLGRAKQEGLNFQKPARFGKGETMTILTTKYLVKNDETGLINIEKTIGKLKEYTNFIEKNALIADKFID